MLRFANRKGRKPFVLRFISANLSVLLVYYFMLPDLALFAQDYRVQQQDFQSFEKSLKNLDRYVDRAGRMQNEQDWSNYVELGVATEFVAWEREALDLLQQGLDRIEEAEISDNERDAAIAEARSAYSAARDAWEDEATLLQLERRGQFRAELAGVDVAEVDVSEYAAMVAQAEAAAFADPDVDLDAFDLSMTTSRAGLETNFEAELAAEIDRARLEHSGLTAVEQQAFEDELARIEAELRQEFEVQDNFYITRSRNRLVALKRSDDLNARLAAESESAESIAEALMSDTRAQIETDTRDMLAAAVEGVQSTLDGADNPDLSDVENDWERQIEAIIDSGLEEWQRAEEDLYASQLAWQRESEVRREAGMAIWRTNYEKLQQGRTDWLSDVETQIADGRQAWDAKFAEFAANRASAEAELAEYVQLQRERWAASSEELVQIIGGGSSALLEAQEGLRYYENLLDEDNGTLAPEVVTFYTGERDRLRGLLTSFGNIIAESEGVLEGRLHSGSGDSGLLRDSRLFAGDLPARVADIPESNFRNELVREMGERSEDFVLYRRDIDALIEANAVFTGRVQDLATSDDFEPDDAADLSALRELVESLERKYDDHRRELLAIVDLDRPGVSDAQRFIDVKNEITAWFDDNDDENVRLKKQTVRYFQGGAAGYFLTGEENDPYLMTEAEMQWELLRRERNYLAKRLNTARAVKDYADRAFLNEAGLEMAAVTAERAEMAGASSKLKEIAFRIIRGDFDLNPAVQSDPAERVRERERLLDEYDVDWDHLQNRETSLVTELIVLDGIMSEAADTDTDFDASLVAINSYLDGLSGDRRAEHPLEILRGKLVAYLDAAAGDITDPEKRNRLDTLTAGTRAVRDMLAEVRADFDFGGMETDYEALLTLMAEPNLKQHQDALDLARADIEANALRLRDATSELEAAQEEYRRARIDFEALRSGNAAELLNSEVRDASTGLAQVLNRMASIEDIPAFAGTVRDEREAAELRYLHDVSESRRFNDREDSAREILAKLEGLELARARRQVMDDIIAAHDPQPADPADLADAFLVRENDLLLRDSTEDLFESHYLPVASLDRLKELKQRHDDLVALTPPAAGPDLEEHRADIAVLKEEIRMALEGFFAGMRAEEQTRQKDAELALNPGADPAPVDRDALADRQTNEAAALEEYARDLAKDATVALNDFLEDNREQSYADLLTIVNDAIDAASSPAGRQVRTGDDPFAAVAARPNGAERDFKIQTMIRDYLVDNRDLIERAGEAPGAGNPDPRSVAAKWDGLLELVGDYETSAEFQSTFEATRPASAGDTRVGDYQDDREDLLEELNDLLGESDAVLLAQYNTLTADRRTLVDLYVRGPGAGTLSDPAALRSALSQARGGVLAELAALPRDFRAILDREDARLATIEINELEDGLIALGQRVAALEFETAGDENEKAELEAALAAETDPAVRTGLSERITALENRITDAASALASLEPQLNADRARYLQLQNELRELQQPGTSAFFGAEALAALRPHQEALTALNGLVRTLEPDYTAPDGTNAIGGREQLGAILGIFETNAYGELLRDAAGDPRTSPEFQNLNIAGVSNQTGAYLRDNLDQVLAGGMRGDHLALWAERLTDWTYANGDTAEPELLGAIELVQESLREYRFAEEILRTRDDTSDQIKSEANALDARATALAEKISEFQALESRLNQELSDAAREERDPLPGALAILEEPDVANILRLFDGFDMTGAADGVTDTDLAARAAELAGLRDHLAAIAEQRAMLAVQEEFTAERASLYGTANPGRTITEVLDAHPELDAASRAALMPLLSEIDRQALRDRDLYLETDLNALMTAYASRATTATSALTPEISAINDADDLATVQAQFVASLDALIPGSAFASIRRDLNAAAATAAGVAELKTRAGDYLAALADPAAAEVELLRGEIAERELHIAVATSDAASFYDPADYPEELREFILVRSYQNAAERYQAFQDLHSSDRADERQQAVLDLSGLSRDVASYFMVADFDDYFASNSAADFRAAHAEGGASLGAYVLSYLEDRRTDSALLPASAYDSLLAREAHREYLRMQNDIVVAGSVAAIDPAAYFAEFSGYLTVAKFEHFATATGYAHPGATRADREAALRTAIDAFLADPAYSVGGETLGQQMPTDAEREDLFQGLLAHLEYGATLDDHLPHLTDRVAAGLLNDPLLAAGDLLSADLQAIPSYETADVRALATAAGADYRAAFARMEVLEAAGGRDLSLFLDDAALEEIVLASGQGDLDAASRAELVALLRDKNLYERAGSDDRTLALRNLRREQAYADIYPDSAARQSVDIFLAGNRAAADSIEETFFRKLAEQGVELSQLAREHRGDLLVSLARRGAGQPDALHGAQNALVQTAIDTMAARLAADLNAAENDLLQNQTAALRDLFDYRSAQELIDSGLIDGIETAALNVAFRGLGRSELDLVRARPDLAARAFAESFYVSEGTIGSLSAESAAFVASVPGLGALLNASVQDLDADLKQTLSGEQVLIERYFDRFQESAADRVELARVLSDPSAIDPARRLSPFNEIQTSASLIGAEAADLTSALQGLINLHARSLAQKSDANLTDREMARRLLEFAEIRGEEDTDHDLTRFEDSRFLNFRTYAGLEEDAYDGGTAPNLADQRIGGGVDASTLLNGDYHSILLSDPAPTNTEDAAFHTVSDNRDAAMSKETARRLYYENLANHFLDATTNLNRALNRVIAAGDLADTRKATSAEDLAADFRAAYDPTATAAQDLTGARNVVQQAATDGAVYNGTRTAESRAKIAGLRGQFEEAGQSFANANRRNLLLNQQMSTYLQSVFFAARDRMILAQEEFEDRQDDEARHRNTFATLTSAHIEAMNKMAEWMRDFQIANDEFDIRREVREFAETPYLFATAEDAYGSIEDADLLQSDALAQYDLARAALEDVQGRLEQAAGQMAIQDNLLEFAAVVDVIETGTPADVSALRQPLSAAERTTLAELRDLKFMQHEVLTTAQEIQLRDLSRRALYERHAPLIASRADYIRHEMQAVRVQKAAEVIKSEVERRQAKADLAREQFEQVMAQMFGSFNASNAASVSEENWKQARDAVHMRMAQMVGNGGNFYNEYRAWYSIANTNSIEHNGRAVVGDIEVDSSTQIAERNTANNFANGLNAGMRESIKIWMQAGGLAGQVGSGFSGGFVPVFNSMIDAAGFKDEKAHVKRITDRNWLPTLVAGAEMIALGLAAGFFQFWLLALIPIGIGMVVAAERHMATAQMELDEADRLLGVARANATSAANPPNLDQLKNAMEGYAAALGDVEYFTKVPDMRTLKKRMVEWGDQHPDQTAPGLAAGADLYRLQDGDLRYLMDQMPNGTPRYIDRDGNAITLNAREQNDALDVTGERDDVQYTDVYGNTYDPATIGERTRDELTLENGTYKYGSAEYVRIQTTSHDGSTQEKFARKVDPALRYQAYNMDTVLGSLAQRNREIAVDYRSDYYARGDALLDESGGAARVFVLNERDDTLEALWERSAARAEGGREFGGYAEVYAAYSANGENVFNDQLGQRAQLQRSEWDLRQRELVEARESWERKINTILSRGRQSWADSENRFLARWRQWEREMDAEDAAGQKVWDERIKEHFTKREDWSRQVREQSSEVTIEAVVGAAATQLNEQLAAASQSLGVDIAGLDKTAVITQAIDEMRASLPSMRDRKVSINAGIKEFSTLLSAHQLTGGDFSIDGAITSDFQRKIDDFRESMTVLANVQMLEQFQSLQETLIQQIDAQNQAIADTTATAALSAGFTQNGAIFNKESGLSGSQISVNAYQWFNARQALLIEGRNRGLTELDGQSLVNHLRDKSKVELAGFFDAQRYALRKAMTAIMGTAHPSNGSTDIEVIGQFWAWAGVSNLDAFELLDNGLNEEQSSVEASMMEANFDLVRFRELMKKLETDETLTNSQRDALATTLAMLQREIQDRQGTDEGTTIDEDTFRGLVSNMGFGQLGGAVKRNDFSGADNIFGAWAPGDASQIKGFFPQLQEGMVSLATADNEWRTERANVDPFSAIVNSINPWVMVVNAKQNYEIQTEIHGMDASEALAGAFASVGKGLLAGIGTALLAATGVGATLSTLIAVAMITTSNSIRIDADGKASMSFGADTAINTLLTVGTAGFGSIGTSSIALKGLGVGISSTLIGIQSNIKYDADGNVTGFQEDAGRVFTDIAVGGLSFGLGRAGGALGKKGGGFRGYLGEELMQQTAITATEYARYVRGEENYYASLANPDLNRLGALYGGYAGGAIGQRVVKRDAYNAREANRNRQNREAADSLRALGVRRREGENWNDSPGSFWRATGRWKKEIGAKWDARGDAVDQFFADNTKKTRESFWKNTRGTREYISGKADHYAQKFLKWQEGNRDWAARNLPWARDKFAKGVGYGIFQAPIDGLVGLGKRISGDRPMDWEAETARVREVAAEMARAELDALNAPEPVRAEMIDSGVPTKLTRVQKFQKMMGDAWGVVRTNANRAWDYAGELKWAAQQNFLDFKMNRWQDMLDFQADFQSYRERAYNTTGKFFSKWGGKAYRGVMNLRSSFRTWWNKYEDAGTNADDGLLGLQTINRSLAKGRKTFSGAKTPDEEDDEDGNDQDGDGEPAPDPEQPEEPEIAGLTADLTSDGLSPTSGEELADLTEQVDAADDLAENARTRLEELSSVEDPTDDSDPERLR